MDLTGVDPHNPLPVVAAWLAAARAAGQPMPEAMTLATAAPNGVPSARMVILRGIDRGLVFFTDVESDKGAELAANPHAAVVLHWLAPRNRQIRAAGPVEVVSDEEADSYWRSRPRRTQANAVISHQSRVIAGRAELEVGVAGLLAGTDGADRVDPAGGGGGLTRPTRWSGWRVLPRSLELWEEASDGLHDRIRWRRQGPGWTTERLSP